MKLRKIIVRNLSLRANSDGTTEISFEPISGEEAAEIILGKADLATSEVYSGTVKTKAIEIANRYGGEETPGESWRKRFDHDIVQALQDGSATYDELRLASFSGMTIQEIRSMRPCDLDTSKPHWEYVSPKGWKAFFSPKAQEILTPYLKACNDPARPIFGLPTDNR